RRRAGREKACLAAGPCVGSRHGAAARTPRPDPSLPSTVRGALGTIMSPSHLRRPAFVLPLLLSACSFANDTLWPSLSGEDPRGPQPAAASGAPASQPPAGGAASASTVASVTPAPPTATGRKTAELRAQLQ